MRSIGRLLMMGLALLMMAEVCAAGQRVAKEIPAKTYRISGVVVDAVTGAAVAGAELTAAGDVELKATADKEGRFVFEGVEEGKYPLYATAPGYVTHGYNQHGSFFTGIAVGSGIDSENLVFKMHRQAVIYGRVTDERGDGVRQATVWLFSEGLQFGKQGVHMSTLMQTNDEGAYRFAHLLPGKYYVGVMGRPWYAEYGVKYQPKTVGATTAGVSQAQESGSDPLFDVVYPVTYFAGATDEEGAVPLMAKAGDAIEANVRLIAVPSVHLLLTNLEDVKRKAQSLNVSAMQRPFEAASVPLNVNAVEISPGVYEVGGLPPGEVRLTVNRGGDAEWDAHGIRVNATDGESVDGNARVATSIVSGTVIAADGSKAEMQGDVALRNGDEESASARLRKDGTFAFPAVEEGTYEVFVNTQGSGDYVAKVTGSGARITGKMVKIEGAGEARLTVTMGRGSGRVTGVVRMDGKPQAGVMVLLLPEQDNLTTSELEQSARMDQSDSDGTFALGGIVPGKYVLMAIEDGWDLEWKEPGALKKYREKGMKVTVEADEEKRVAVEGIRSSEGENGKQKKENSASW